MSSCINLEFIKSPSSSSSSSWPSSSSSPSSTLSESSLAISTRKPRTPRKRPNQTYIEAFAILSTAHPKIFPAKNLTKITTKIPFFEPPDLLMPLQVIDTSRVLLLGGPHFSKGFEKACLISPVEISSKENFEENFDAESILDEEIGEGIGIDSIMGKSSIENGVHDESNVLSSMQMNTSCYGYGVRNEMRAMRKVDEVDWWSFPCVHLLDLNPKMTKVEKKKKKKKVDIINLEPNRGDSILNPEPNKEDLAIEGGQNTNVGLLLKLNYDSVLNEWSDKASPFSGDAPASESAGKDVQARLAQIDLFSNENGGIREASVLRYKEKRRTRPFSKKIRYQVRKFNDDRRPRMKGRFARTPNSSQD